jgi:hypothetical protein
LVEKLTTEGRLKQSGTLQISVRVQTCKDSSLKEFRTVSLAPI